VSPVPRRRCRRSGRGVEERRGDERERAERRRSPGISDGAALTSAGGASSSLSLTRRPVVWREVREIGGCGRPLRRQGLKGDDGP
jgi:hypothetical protein